MTRSKLEGTPVSKEDVIADLSRPSAEWERNSRRIEFQNRLRRGQTDLDISGIRGYGCIEGYLAYLQKSLLHPLGSNTGLVSDEENEKIRQEANAETQAEIQRIQERLLELEAIPSELQAYINEMQRWLEYVEKVGPEDVASQPIEELQELARVSNAKREQEIASLKANIADYKKRLAQLQVIS